MSTTRHYEYHRPWLYPAQAAFLFTPKRYSIVEASTKTGKTVGCIIWLFEQAIGAGHPGRNYWWVAPIYAQAKVAFRRLKDYLPARYEGGFWKPNESELTIMLANKSTIWFKGADKPDSLYGEDVYAAVIDEATRCKEEAWHALRSTLTATRGPVRIIGNVKGRRNWAYKLARLAEAGEPNMHYAKLTAYDAVDGGVLELAEVEDAKRVLPENVFNELYLGIPSDDGGNPFGVKAIAA
ncbi:MAG: terminase large subunit domain-containing protein, partial [Steroidobacteraceae bacterium]